MKEWKASRIKVIGILSGLIILSQCLSPERSYAYIDPGTGSYFLQFLVAGLLALLYSLKVYWKKIRDFFSRRTPEK